MASRTPKTTPALSAPIYFNRELSWLAFNRRVLEQAQTDRHPLIERVRYLAITGSNLDEFFQIRVAGLMQQRDSGVTEPGPDGLNPSQQLQRIRATVDAFIEDQYRCWRDQLAPALAIEGIHFKSAQDLSPRELAWVRAYFREQVYPVLTPLALDQSHPFPQLGNKELNIVVTLDNPATAKLEHLVAILPVPRILPRLVSIAPGGRGPQRIIFLSEIIKLCAGELFPGYRLTAAHAFRVTRNSELYIDEEEAANLLVKIEAELRNLRRGAAVRLEIEDGVNAALFATLCHELALPPDNVFRLKGPINLMRLQSIGDLDRPDLKFPSFTPVNASPLRDPSRIFEALRAQDILLHHPYDSFDPVVDFVTSAANDPRVLAIKQTLYRTSGDSPISRALMAAAESGKHVTALVELKARFDEANNVNWARRMEQAGVHVVFGFLDLKTHCKVSLVVRQEGQGLRRYVHLGTGNYNPTTALLYTDLGLFTADEEIAEDASALFNLLTGYSQGHAWRKLIIAPNDLQRRTLELIDEQAQLARNRQPSRIFIKLNSLVDHSVIEALYRASQAGVPIDIVARGICCLRPGLPGLSENIRVRSIVDRFLEHSRIYVFGPDNEAKVFLSSADWMPRNFVRRVEVMFPVLAAELVTRILKEIVPVYLADNTRARQLDVDGRFHLLQPAAGEFAYRCQEELLKQRAAVDSVTSSALDTGAGAVEQAAAVGG